MIDTERREGARTGLASAYLFAQDLVDEGIEVVLDRLQESGLNGVMMAAAYHHGRDVFPHNPVHKIVYHDGGVVYFHPNLSLYRETRLKPRVARIAQRADPLSGLMRAAQSRGIEVGLWLAVLHNSRLAMAHPGCALVNAHGDRLLNSLCPANPQVRAFVRALVRDAASHRVHSIELEALAYPPFDHGYHHERSFIRLSPNARYLLGLCFCKHCLVAAASAGVDGDRVRARVREVTQMAFDSVEHETSEREIDQASLRAEAGGELGHYLDVRESVVTALVREATVAAHAECPEARVVFLDLSGGVLGYSTGRPTTDLGSVSIAWRDGVDIPAVAGACDAIGVLAYFADQDRFEREIDAYCQAVASPHDLEVLLRPMLPDVQSPEALGMKIASLRRAGITAISFYHYGFMRLESLDWIRAGLSLNS